MDGTAAAGSTSHAAPRAARVFLGDTRLAVTALNEGRHYALNRAFGVSREQANLLTFVLALGAADGAYATTRRVLHGPFPVSSSDATLGGMLMREAALGVAGPAARKVPFAGALLTAALVGGLAVPGLRRAAHEIRAAESRVRRQRMAVYAAGAEAARRRRETA
jgi:hypothetical protein